MYGLRPENLYTIHQGQSNDYRSPKVWEKAIESEMSAGSGRSAFYWEDRFQNWGAPGTTTSTNQGYGTYVDSSNTILANATRLGGITLTTDGTDNDEVWVQGAGGVGAQARISRTAGQDKLTVFEAEISKGQIGNNSSGMFVGLGEVGMAVVETLTDTDANLVNKDYIGFHIDQADGDKMDFVYNKTGGAQTVLIPTVHVPVVDAAVKLGFVYDPDAEDAKKIAIYVNGAVQSTYVTATLMDVAANFPNGDFLSLLCGFKNGGAVAQDLNLNWWAVYQEQ